ncbi:uncharacterized protein TrAFT101_003090 [Trichoderma asperellum]|uniref:uncharacterized protein n=1 Tax=Trichoderma asperellum TaxID=101201 RepID=UPI00331EF85F|nr:hypothetical protein TrAFT101_003090 [Trichoderma asperellum]
MGATQILQDYLAVPLKKEEPVPGADILDKSARGLFFPFSLAMAGEVYALLRLDD